MSVFAANSYRGGGSLDRMSALMTADSPSLVHDPCIDTDARWHTTKNR